MLLFRSKGSRGQDRCWGLVVSGEGAWKGVRRTCYSACLKISTEFAFGDSTIDSVYILKANFLIAPVIVVTIPNKS